MSPFEKPASSIMPHPSVREAEYMRDPDPHAPSKLDEASEESTARVAAHAKLIEEGVAAYRSKTPCPYDPNSFEFSLFHIGWKTEMERALGERPSAPAAASFDPTKPFTTRDGREVSGFDMVAGYPRVFVSGVGPIGWRNDGRVYANYYDNDLDLVNVAAVLPVPSTEEREDDRARPQTRTRDATPLSVTYTNHRGETSVRRIIPLGPPVWDSTEWHPEPQGLLREYDVDKQAERLFALKDFAPLASPDAIAVVERMRDEWRGKNGWAQWAADEILATLRTLPTQSIRERTIEECAKVVDRLVDNIFANHMAGNSDELNAHSQARLAARDIRALAAAKPTEAKP